MNESYIKRKLLEKARIEREKKEKGRQVLLEKTISVLKKEFSGMGVEIYLVGSIIKPYAFTQKSDIDIVIKGYSKDRFDLWTRLEGIIERNIEIILYEKCPFKEDLNKLGLKVVL